MAVLTIPDAASSLYLQVEKLMQAPERISVYHYEREGDTVLVSYRTGEDILWTLDALAQVMESRERAERWMHSLGTTDPATICEDLRYITYTAYVLLAPDMYESF
jgi:hypothetical protein